MTHRDIPLSFETRRDGKPVLMGRRWRSKQYEGEHHFYVTGQERNRDEEIRSRGELAARKHYRRMQRRRDWLTRLIDSFLRSLR